MHTNFIDKQKSYINVDFNQIIDFENYLDILNNCEKMSTTMRSTLQTVPESLPADHITNTLSTTVTSTAPTENAATKSTHSHTNSSLKGRQSTTKVYIHI